MGYITDFYRGKCIFLTGVTGFLGKVVLVKLLHQLPELRRIYVLIRDKSDLPARKRLKKIYKLPLFDPMREQLGKDFKPFVKDKVIAVRGDILQDKLGIDAELYEQMQREVNVIMHGAATISFNEPILEAIDQNVLGTLRVWELATGCDDLQVFCHVSTAYTNSNKGGFVEEKLYPLPFNPEKVLDDLMHMNEVELKRQEKKLLGRHPNTYTFTKSITEHLLRDRRGSIPLVFCRPSIINATARDPFPGWIDSLAAGASFVVGYGSGFIRFLPSGTKDFVIDQIPVDYVANCMIASSAYNGNRDRLSVYHIASSERNPVTLRQIFDWVQPMFVTNPHKRALLKVEKMQWLTGPTARLEYNIRSALFWSVPVMLYSSFANTIGGRSHQRKATLLRKVGARVNKAVNDFYFFMTNDLVFSMAESDPLNAEMDDRERAMFGYDVAALDWPKQIFYFALGLRKYAQGEKDLAVTYRGDFIPPSRNNRGLYLKRRPFGDMSFATIHPIQLTTGASPITPSDLRRRVFLSSCVQQAIEEESSRTGKPQPQVEKRAREILEEMGAEMSPSMIRTLAWLFRKVYRRLYTAVTVNETGIEGMRRACKEGLPMLLLPSHRSYVDFLIISYMAYSFKLAVPHIASGNTFLSVIFVRWLMRHSGAFFMRRSFGDDALYRMIFTEYTQTLLELCYPVEFFLEGTRSRSNKSMHPKFGLLGICTDAFFMRRVDDLTIVPISISYEKPVDESGHVRELLGEEKQPETLSGLVMSLRWLLSLDFGRITVQFAAPFKMSEFAAAEQETPKPILATRLPLEGLNTSTALAPLPSLPLAKHPRELLLGPGAAGSDGKDAGAPWRKHVTVRLGYHVARQIKSNMICMSTTLVSTLVLTHPNGLTRKQLVEKYVWLKDLIRERGGWVDVVLLKVEFVVDRAVKLLGDALIRHNGVYRPNPALLLGRRDDKARVQLCYFRNPLLHIFQAEGLLALALAAACLPAPASSDLASASPPPSGLAPGAPVPRDVVFERFRFLRNLLFNEFIYADQSVEEQFNSTLDFAIEQEWVEATDHEVQVPAHGERMCWWLCLLFWPFTEAYWVAGLACVASLQDGRTITKYELVDQAQVLAEKLWDEGIVCHYEARVKETLRNAVNLFLAWGVLQLVSTDPKRATVELGRAFVDDEGALADLVAHIGQFRRTPLREVFRNTSSPSNLRQRLLADFPVIARL